MIATTVIGDDYVSCVVVHISKAYRGRPGGHAGQPAQATRNVRITVFPSERGKARFLVFRGFRSSVFARIRQAESRLTFR